MYSDSIGELTPTTRRNATLLEPCFVGLKSDLHGCTAWLINSDTIGELTPTIDTQVRN